MITTPFGPIKIYTDDVVLDYEAIPHAYHRGPAKDHPIAGRFAVKLILAVLLFAIQEAPDNAMRMLSLSPALRS